jgi:O-antigen/teichoic acid export membrane protein
VNHPLTIDIIQKNRSKRVLQAGFSAIVSKVIVLGVSAFSIPIAVRYLGAEQFGIWVTVSASLALLVLLDLGIASSMTNLISEAYTRNDKDLASRYAVTGFWTMVLVALALGLIGAAIWPFMHWDALFGLKGEAIERMISHAVAAAFVVFLVGLPAGLAAKFLAGYQEIKIANIFSAISAMANLAAIILIVRLHGSMVLMVAGSSGAMVGANLACLAWLWFYHKPWLAPTLRRFHLPSVRPLLQSGADFFVLQLAALIVFNSDNLVIAHFLGPAQVTPYSVTWRLVGYAAALQTVVTPALWPAYAEAYLREDLQWIRRTLAYVMVASLGLAGLCCLVFTLWGRSIIRVWAGPAAVPPESLIVLMCIWIMIAIFMGNTSTVLTATGQIGLQARLSALAAAINLVASIWLVHSMGPNGVIIGTIASYLLVLVVPQTWKVIQVIFASGTTATVAAPVSVR